MSIKKKCFKALAYFNRKCLPSLHNEYENLAQSFVGLQVVDFKELIKLD